MSQVRDTVAGVGIRTNVRDGKAPQAAQGYTFQSQSNMEVDERGLLNVRAFMCNTVSQSRFIFNKANQDLNIQAGALWPRPSEAADDAISFVQSQGVVDSNPTVGARGVAPHHLNVTTLVYNVPAGTVIGNIAFSGAPLGAALVDGFAVKSVPFSSQTGQTALQVRDVSGLADFAVGDYMLVARDATGALIFRRFDEMLAEVDWFVQQTCSHAVNVGFDQNFAFPALAPFESTQSIVYERLQDSVSFEPRGNFEDRLVIVPFQPKRHVLIRFDQSRDVVVNMVEEGGTLVSFDPVTKQANIVLNDTRPPPAGGNTTLVYWGSTAEEDPNDARPISVVYAGDGFIATLVPELAVGPPPVVPPPPVVANVVLVESQGAPGAYTYLYRVFLDPWQSGAFVNMEFQPGADNVVDEFVGVSLVATESTFGIYRANIELNALPFGTTGGYFFEFTGSSTMDSMALTEPVTFLYETGGTGTYTGPGQGEPDSPDLPAQPLPITSFSTVDRFSNGTGGFYGFTSSLIVDPYVPRARLRVSWNSDVETLVLQDDAILGASIESIIESVNGEPTVVFVLDDVPIESGGQYMLQLNGSTLSSTNTNQSITDPIRFDYVDGGNDGTPFTGTGVPLPAIPYLTIGPPPAVNVTSTLTDQQGVSGAWRYAYRLALDNWHPDAEFIVMYGANDENFLTAVQGATLLSYQEVDNQYEARVRLDQEPYGTPGDYYFELNGTSPENNFNNARPETYAYVTPGSAPSYAGPGLGEPIVPLTAPPPPASITSTTFTNVLINQDADASDFYGVAQRFEIDPWIPGGSLQVKWISDAVIEIENLQIPYGATLLNFTDSSGEPVAVIELDAVPYGTGSVYYFQYNLSSDSKSNNSNINRTIPVTVVYVKGDATNAFTGTPLGEPPIPTVIGVGPPPVPTVVLARQQVNAVSPYVYTDRISIDPWLSGAYFHIVFGAGDENYVQADGMYGANLIAMGVRADGLYVANVQLDALPPTNASGEYIVQFNGSSPEGRVNNTLAEVFIYDSTGTLYMDAGGPEPPILPLPVPPLTINSTSVTNELISGTGGSYAWVQRAVIDPWVPGAIITGEWRSGDLIGIDDANVYGATLVSLTIQDSVYTGSWQLDAVPYGDAVDYSFQYEGTSQSSNTNTARTLQGAFTYRDSGIDGAPFTGAGLGDAPLPAAPPVTIPEPTVIFAQLSLSGSNYNWSFEHKFSVSPWRGGKLLRVTYARNKVVTIVNAIVGAVLAATGDDGAGRLTFDFTLNATPPSDGNGDYFVIAGTSIERRSQNTAPDTGRFAYLT